MTQRIPTVQIRKGDQVCLVIRGYGKNSMADLLDVDSGRE